MKAYISLSRVKKVHDLYLPQAFSPALFRQGEQPWPTLLLQCLKGEHQGREKLEEEAIKAERKCRKPKKLKDFHFPWACGKCGKTSDYDGFLVEDSNVEEEWYTAYWEKIIAPGYGRLCMDCKGETRCDTSRRVQKCDVCGKEKTKADFPDSMWHHKQRKDRRCLCLDCSHPPCTAQECKTCSVCRDPKCKKRTK